MDEDFDVINYASRGAIAEMAMPPGWTWHRVPSGSTAKLYYFQPPTPDDVRFCFFYRGQPMGEIGARALRKILDEKPHVLTELELEDISEAAESFVREDRKLNATTVDINGKTVVELRGRSPDNRAESYIILIDAGGDGRWVAELFLEATVDHFGKYLPMIEESLKSIKWASDAQAVSG
jgi:hypothetical protein